MIWKKTDITAEAKQASLFIQDQIGLSGTTAEELAPHSFSKRIGIVGGGPKGMYALERLLHELQRNEDTHPLDVVWFNETADFGSGHNYQTEQPDHLLINYCIGNIDAWLRTESNTCIDEQLSLTEWIASYNATDQEVQPTDFASRALVGCYLQDVLKKIIASKTGNIRLTMVTGTVDQVNYADRFQIHLRDSDRVFTTDFLLMSTGHCYQNAAPFSGLSAKNYLQSAYPVKQLNRIPAAVPVAVMGMGLTFIDICLQLTEGRGGTFSASGAYIPSGHEPIIYPFSRSNLPIQPRGPVYGKSKYMLREETRQALHTLASTRLARQVDFQKEVYPIIDAEVRFAYYSTLLQTKAQDEVNSYIETLPNEEQFSFQELLFPENAAHQRVSELERHANTLDYINESIARAERGELNDPLMAAAAVWREATPFIGEIYAFGGLTPESQAFLDQKIFGACCRTSFGPPIANMQKISALANAGVIQFDIPPASEIRYDELTEKFYIGTQEETHSMAYLIDGRIARSHAAPFNAPLYQQMAEEKLVQPFRNGDYQPGCVAINREGRADMTPATTLEIPLFFYGTPTEGVLFDNDSLSRVRNNLGSAWAKALLNLIHAKTHSISA